MKYKFTKKVMISTKNTVLTNSRIHDGASDPRKTVATFHSFYGHGRTTSRGTGWASALLLQGGGGVKNIIEALTFWERIPTDPSQEQTSQLYR